MFAQLEKDIGELQADYLALVRIFNTALHAGDKTLTPLAHEVFGTDDAGSEAVEAAWREQCAANIRNRFNEYADLSRGAKITAQYLQTTADGILEAIGEGEVPGPVLSQVITLAEKADSMAGESAMYLDRIKTLADLLSQHHGADKEKLLGEIAALENFPAQDHIPKIDDDMFQSGLLIHQDGLIAKYIAAARGHLDLARLDMAYLGAHGSWLNTPLQGDRRIYQLSSIQGQALEAHRFSTIGNGHLRNAIAASRNPVFRKNYN